MGADLSPDFSAQMKRTEKSLPKQDTPAPLRTEWFSVESLCYPSVIRTSGIEPALIFITKLPIDHRNPALIP